MVNDNNLLLKQLESSLCDLSDSISDEEESSVSSSKSIIVAYECLAILSRMLCNKYERDLKFTKRNNPETNPINCLCDNFDYVSIPFWVADTYYSLRDVRNIAIDKNVEFTAKMREDFYTLFFPLFNWSLDNLTTDNNKKQIEALLKLCDRIETIFHCGTPIYREPTNYSTTFELSESALLEYADNYIDSNEDEEQLDIANVQEQSNKNNNNEIKHKSKDDYDGKTLSEVANYLKESMTQLLEKTDEIREHTEVSSKNTEEIKDKMNLIIDFLNSLEDTIIDQKETINAALSKCEKNGDEIEADKLIASFANDVTDKIIQGVSNQYVEHDYEIEKATLINTFGEVLWSKLSERSQDYLITAKTLYRSMILKDKLDYSGICLLLTKAVEYELYERLFVKYKNYLTNNYNNYNDWPDYFFDENNRPIRNEDFTLGSIAYFCCTRSSKYYDAQHNKRIVREFAKNVLFSTNDENKINNNLKFIGDCAEKIRTEYRNPAAHKEPMRKIKADECLAYIVDVTKVLVKLMEMFKS